MKKFWMVFLEGGSAPSHKHESFDSAFAEMERLAKNHRGRKAWVLEAISSVVASDLIYEGDSPLPF